MCSGGEMETGRVIKLVVDCSDCGHVKIDPHSVTIRRCVEADSWAYWFVCPSCRARTAASTNPLAALGAVSAGSSLDIWTMPAEVNERPSAPPLTKVDVLELHLLLMDPDWIDQLS